MSNWPKQKDCLKLFGNPSHPEFADQHLVRVEPPFPMAMGAIPIHSFLVNKLCAGAMLKALGNYWETIGHDTHQLAKDGVNVFSGTWNVRNMRGINQVSMHAFGLAIDINAPKNPLGRKPGLIKGSFTKDSPLVKCFLEQGATWGGVWSRPDGMHFQFADVK